ncbi:WD40 repeat domain-containing protein [Alicyclobacillus dauci]|uniref:WD40 repeat domain-containing protein n=1 Tax=Alicyclobacillus dauci TaxID=1475485 RepID=A0ABY6Z6C6_9BACL|nr:WD40 repeat domain-containing protein [Alicyclobacillus dauci]WAH37580.1 WD40 repeat domain-containing protein [Alicyclobacillus dauci]
MFTHRLRLGVAMASGLAMIALVSGCQSSHKEQVPQAPATVPKGTLTAVTSDAAFVYLDGKWEVLAGGGPNDQPSDPLKTIDFSPKGTLTATTVGSNDDALTGNSVGLWLYDKGWQQVTPNGDKTVAVYGWSPSNVLYAIPDDGQTKGIWYQSNGKWQVVNGSASFGFINSIQWSPTGIMTIVAEASDGSSSVWQYVNGKWDRLDYSSVPFAADGLQVEWSPSGVLTLATSAHGVWQYVGGSWSQPGGVNSPIGNVTQLAWSPQGELLISGDSKKALGLWQLQNTGWSRVGGADAPFAKDGIRQFGWSPTGTLTVSDSTNGKIYQMESGKWTAVWNNTPSDSHSVIPITFGWSPSGLLTCNGGFLGGIWQYQSGTWNEVGGDNSPLKNQAAAPFAWSK